MGAPKGAWLRGSTNKKQLIDKPEDDDYRAGSEAY